MECTTCGAPNQTKEFCDDCGSRVAGGNGATPSSNAAAPAGVAAASPAPTSTSVQAGTALGGGPAAWHPEIKQCPGCGGDRQKITPVCRMCGFNYKEMKAAAPKPGSIDPATVDPNSGSASAPLAVAAAPVRSSTIAMKAVVSCDETLYTDPDPTLPFPTTEGAMEFVLNGEDMLVGRQSRKNTVQPAVFSNTDPGVSRHHLRLLLQADGRYAADDRESDNGTLLIPADKASEGLKAAVEIKGKLTPINPGDVLVLGYWTRIEFQAR